MNRFEIRIVNDQEDFFCLRNYIYISAKATLDRMPCGVVMASANNVTVACRRASRGFTKLPNWYGWKPASRKKLLVFKVERMMNEATTQVTIGDVRLD